MSKINVNQSAPLIITEIKKKEDDDDKSNYDPDRDILRKFLNEQKKEREDYIKLIKKLEEIKKLENNYIELKKVKNKIK